MTMKNIQNKVTTTTTATLFTTIPLMMFSIPATAAASSSQVDCDANPDDAFCNSEKGRNGLPFRDIVRNAVGCCERNDNPKEYCEKHKEVTMNLRRISDH